MKRTRVFSFLLALVMIIALLPVSALAVTTISNVTVNFPAPAYNGEFDNSNRAPALSFGDNDGKITADVGEWLYNEVPVVNGKKLYVDYPRVTSTTILTPASGYKFTSSTKVEVHDTNFGIEGDPDMLYCNKEYQSDGTIKVTIHLYSPDRYRNDFHEKLRVRELPLGITQLPQVGWHKSDAETYSEVYVKNSSDYYAFATTPPPDGSAWQEVGWFNPNNNLPEAAYQAYDTIKAGMLLYTWLDIELDGDGGWWRLGVQNFTFPDLSAEQQQGLSARIAYLDWMEGQSPATTTDLTRARVYLFYRVPGANHIDQINMTFDDFKPINRPDSSSGYQLKDGGYILPNFEITNNAHCSMSPEYLSDYDWDGYIEGPDYPEGEYFVTLILDVEDGYYIDENTVINIVGRHGRPATVQFSSAEYGSAMFGVTYYAKDYAALEIAEQPWDDYANIGETASTTVTAHGVGLTYQWYVKDPGSSSFTKSSITKKTYSISMTEAKSGRQVYCIVKDSSGNSVKTRTATLWANIPLAIVTQPKDASAPLGQTASTTVVAKGSNLHYTWYVKDVGNPDFTESSITKATYSITMTAARNGRQVFCVVDDGEEEVTTNTVTLTVSSSKPTITSQPSNVSVAVGSTATFKVTATGATSYQWYYRTSSTGTWTAVSASSGKTSTYKLTTAARHNGYQYRCKVTNAAGSVYSNTVTLTVKPKITTQPTNKTVTAGTTVHFKVTAENATSYQWYYRKSSTDAWTAVSAASGKTADYSLTAAARHNGYQYRCKVMNATSYVYSSIVTLNVT